jgi:hypothetical protein
MGENGIYGRKGRINWINGINGITVIKAWIRASTYGKIEFYP